MTDDEKLPPWDGMRFIHSIRQHWIVLLIGFVAGTIIAGGQMAGALKGGYELIFPKPDALALAREDAKDKLSRELVESIWRRLYLSQNFLARVRRRASDSEIKEAWTKLLDSVEDMSSKTMIYAVSLGEFYNERRRNEWESGIQLDFTKITERIVNFRYSPAVKKLEFPSLSTSALTNEENQYVDATVKEINEMLTRLNLRIYHFASCFDKKNQTDKGCRFSAPVAR
jgi:hypothetical protein